MAKVAQITAAFPDIQGQELETSGEASTIRAAVSRAVAALLKDPLLKGKRLTTINMVVTLGNKTAEASVEPQEAAE